MLNREMFEFLEPMDLPAQLLELIFIQDHFLKFGQLAEYLQVGESGQISLL